MKLDIEKHIYTIEEELEHDLVDVIIDAAGRENSGYIAETLISVTADLLETGFGDQWYEQFLIRLEMLKNSK